MADTTDSGNKTTSVDLDQQFNTLNASCKAHGVPLDKDLAAKNNMATLIAKDPDFSDNLFHIINKDAAAYATIADARKSLNDNGHDLSPTETNIDHIERIQGFFNAEIVRLCKTIRGDKRGKDL